MKLLITFCFFIFLITSLNAQTFNNKLEDKENETDKKNQKISEKNSTTKLTESKKDNNKNVEGVKIKTIAKSERKQKPIKVDRPTPSHDQTIRTVRANRGRINVVRPAKLGR